MIKVLFAAAEAGAALFAVVFAAGAFAEFVPILTVHADDAAASETKTRPKM